MAAGAAGVPPPRSPPPPGQLPFAALCDLFDELRGQKAAVVRRQRVRSFVQAAAPDGCKGAFQLIRWKDFLCGNGLLNLKLFLESKVLKICLFRPRRPTDAQAPSSSGQCSLFQFWILPSLKRFAAFSI